MAPSSIAAKAHAGNIYLMAGHEGAEVPDDPRPVLVIQKENHARGDNLSRLAENAHNTGIVRGAKERAASRGDLFLPAEHLNVEPFIEGDRLVRALLLDSHSEGG